tara:strand:- start:1667 stop:2116 length:450 start_codon:yes stop_codon:yes gene_type:complete
LKVTQYDQILFFFSNNQDMEYTPSDIYKEFPTFAQSSIRRILKQELVKRDNRLIQESYGHYNYNDQFEETEYYTKILKTGASGKHEKNLVASTWENKKNPLRFKELKKALLDFADLNKIRTKDLGYENNKKLNEPLDIPQFPEIEVTTE